MTQPVHVDAIERGRQERAAVRQRAAQHMALEEYCFSDGEINARLLFYALAWLCLLGGGLSAVGGYAVYGLLALIAALLSFVAAGINYLRGILRYYAIHRLEG